jgi:hypothetical protein
LVIQAELVLAVTPEFIKISMPENKDSILSNKTLGLKRKSNRNKTHKSVSDNLKLKTNFKTRFIGTYKKVAEYKILKQEYFKRKNVQEKTIDKDRETGTKNQTDEGRNARSFAKMTKPGLLAYECLRELKLAPISEYKIMAKYFDFYIKGCEENEELSKKIKDVKILIEIDGEYFHGQINDDNKESDLSSRQRKQRIEDIYKNAVAIGRGYKLIRIYANDVSKDALKDLINEKLMEKYPNGDVLI